MSNHSIPGHQAYWATKPIELGYLRWAPYVTGEKILIANAANPGRLRDMRTLGYRVAIKAGFYCKAVQVYHIPITTTYTSSSFFCFFFFVTVVLKGVRPKMEVKMEVSIYLYRS